jgi:uncharacterized protein (DUF1800 family)
MKSAARPGKARRMAGPLGAAGAAAALVAAALVMGAAPYRMVRGAAGPARSSSHSASAHPPKIHLSKAFKGRLPITELTEDQAVLHALNRLAYGPRPGELERVKQMGLEKWIDEQLHPERIDDSAVEERLREFPVLRMSSEQLLNHFPTAQMLARREGISREQAQQEMAARAPQAMPAPEGQGMADPAAMQLERLRGPRQIVAQMAMAKLVRAVYSRRQLDEVMSNFWFNHFNVYAAKGADLWLLPAYEREAIRPHAMGKFEELLEATAKSPAMLFYLDNWMSADPNAAQRVGRQFGMRRRELRGVFACGRLAARPNFFSAMNCGWRRPPGRRAKAGAGQAAGKKKERGLNENYGRELMELHTIGVDGGFTQADVIEVARALTGWTIRAPRRDPEFAFNDRAHSPGPKVVMGHKIDAGGMGDGEEVLRLLARSPSAARFMSTELARHFVSDNPPPALVHRMAKTFLEKDGDIRAVLRTMIYSPEFWSLDAYRAKMKSPFELAASTLRATGAEVNLPLSVVRWVARMGEPLYLCQPPSGYPDTADAWISAGALLDRMDFALAVASDHMPGTVVNVEQLLGGDSAGDPGQALDRAFAVLLGGQVSAQTRAALAGVLSRERAGALQPATDRLVAGFVLGSPDFERR